MLHFAEVTREVNFKIRGNPWKLDRRAEALGTSSHRTDNFKKDLKKLNTAFQSTSFPERGCFPINKGFFNLYFYSEI